MGAGEGERGEDHGDLAQALAILKGEPEDQGSRPEEAAQTLLLESHSRATGPRPTSLGQRTGQF